MNSQWIKYDGSDEQLRQLLSTSDKFIVDSQWSIFREPSTIELLDTDDNIKWLAVMLRDAKVKAYLICSPHPLADMICQWARTGQPVWVRIPVSYERYGYCYITYGATNTPDWNIPGAEYSFTPF